MEWFGATRMHVDNHNRIAYSTFDNHLPLLLTLKMLNPLKTYEFIKFHPPMHTQGLCVEQIATSPWALTATFDVNMKLKWYFEGIIMVSIPRKNKKRKKKRASSPLSLEVSNLSSTNSRQSYLLD